MTDFRLAQLSWIHLIWLVAGLALLLVWLQRRGGKDLSSFLSAVMQPRLVERQSPLRRWTAWTCLLLSCTAMALALARPQWGVSHRETPQVGAQIMVCLDVSKSMLAEDTAPNRLERAKAELVDLLGYLDGDQVGLIAFAGKATVLCPLTPDFGFLQFIIADAGPHSVGRGGTRLEEPLRKATEGFRGQADVSRVVLLITDGEDHDSFPLEAAKAAAERGIRIICIGFGSEAGSEIYVTNPRTGAREPVRDASGNRVVSRLDGQILRDIALATEGVYIPAGDAALALESIYNVHIAPLVRGELTAETREVRNEIFQIPVFCAFVLLILGVVVGSGREGHAVVDWQLSPSAAVAILVVFGCTSVLYAQDATASGELPDDADPRDVYNQALARLDASPDEAEALFTRARREAGTDGEVRYRAVYHLGWVEIQRADAALAEQPAEALEHLRAAADWFREAIRLRPDAQDARYNLEIILRRAMQLADALAEKEERDLTRRLEDLIQRQRTLTAETRPLVEQLRDAEDPHAAERFRSQFRQLAVQQRLLLSDAEAFASSARAEVDATASKNAADTTPAEQLRQTQLSAMLLHLYEAQQRMGQTRTQLRRGQAERSFRRSASSLAALKRARDQLRDPVELLGVLIGDATETARLTATLAEGTRVTVGETEPAAPSWLTSDYCREEQADLTARTSELHEKLDAGIQQQKPPVGPAAPEQDAAADAQAELLNQLRQATSLVEYAVDDLRGAEASLANGTVYAARREQLSGIQKLQEAREWFLDVRGLIEQIYNDESSIQRALLSVDEETAGRLPALAAFAVDVQQKNLDRSKRLARMLTAEKRKLTTDTPAGPPAPGQAAPSHEALQRVELAEQLLAQAYGSMDRAHEALERLANPEPTADASGSGLQPAREEVGAAVEALQQLRRLYFTLIEHLRDTAQRQSQLNDITEELIGLTSPDNVAQELSPLATRQSALQANTSELAEAFEQQAQQPVDAASGPTMTDEQQQQLEESRRQLAEAGVLVAAGSTLMKEAATQLQGPGLDPGSARESQDQALEKLLEALAKLSPPDSPQQQRGGEQPSPDQQQQGAQQQEKQQQANADPARLLQAVRDQEARRRREKGQRQPDSGEPVAKDW